MSPFSSPLASPPATDPGFPRPPPPRQSLAGDHADASSRILMPPRGSRRADASSPAVVEVPASWPWWIPASWPWWRSTVGSGRSTARSTEEEGAAAKSMGEEVTTGSVEEEVVVARSGERKREE